MLFIITHTVHVYQFPRIIRLALHILSSCVYTPYEGLRRTRSWRFLAGNWREATPDCIVILINIEENKTVMCKWYISHVLEL